MENVGLDELRKQIANMIALLQEQHTNITEKKKAACGRLIEKVTVTKRFTVEYKPAVWWMWMHNIKICRHSTSLISHRVPCFAVFKFKVNGFDPKTEEAHQFCHLNHTHWQSSSHLPLQNVL